MKQNILRLQSKRITLGRKQARTRLLGNALIVKHIAHIEFYVGLCTESVQHPLSFACF